MAIEHADFEGIERLALVLGEWMWSPKMVCQIFWYFLLCAGGEIVSTFGNPEKVKLGHCELIEEVMIGEDKVSKILVMLPAHCERGGREGGKEGGRMNMHVLSCVCVCMCVYVCVCVCVCVCVVTHSLHF